MFTGIVSALGHVVDWRPGHIALQHQETAAQLQPGASVAVNGVCLTVTGVEGKVFLADVVPETRRRTNLGHLGPGDPVNLELPLTLQQGLDGHLVQGHVDATAEIAAVREVDPGREVTIGLPAALAPYVAEKGSIAVDGVSLTVTGVDDSQQTFEVALIPHTLDHTIAGRYVAGTLVNLEVDLVARYVERVLDRRAIGGRQEGGC